MTEKSVIWSGTGGPIILSCLLHDYVIEMYVLQRRIKYILSENIKIFYSW